MTAAVLIRDSDTLGWKAHGHVDKFENDAAYKRLCHLEDAGPRRNLLLPAPKRLVEPQLAEILAAGITPAETVDAGGNMLLNAGIARLGALLIGAGGQAFVNTWARIGAGNGTTAVVNTDTDLSAVAGSANRWFNAADATYPTFAAQVLTIVSTFSSANGQFAWNEWGFDFGGAGTSTSSATVGAPLMNRKVPTSLGTKGAVAWAFTATITLS
jgi:hypothetical protein